MAAWSDVGYVLGARAVGASRAVVDIVMRGRGRWVGVSGRRSGPAIGSGQASWGSGLLVRAHWRGRSDAEDAIGWWRLDVVEDIAGRILDKASRLAVLGWACRLTRALLPERAAAPRAFDALAALVGALRDATDAGWGAALARFELAMLEEAGAGLDLSCCALTGARGVALAWVSPRTGRACTYAAGEPWKARLLPLPRFLLAEQPVAADASEVAHALRLTGQFLAQRAPLGRIGSLPYARRAVEARFARAG